MSNSGKFRIRGVTSWLRPLQKMMDVFAILCGLYTLITWMPDMNSKSTIVVGLVAIGMFSLIGEFLGLYRNWQGQGFNHQASCTLLSWVATVIALIILGQFTEYSTEVSGRGLWLWATVTPVYQIGFRSLLRSAVVSFSEFAGTTRGFAVIGTNELSVELVRKIRAQSDLGLRFLGFYDDRPADRSFPLPEDMNVRAGNIPRLCELAKRGEIQVIYITLPLRAEERIRRIVSELADSTASVYLVPDVFAFQLLHSRWTDIQGIPAVSIYENPLFGVDGVFKRICDIAFASLALLIAGLPMLLVAVAVKLTSRGPVIFKQKRYGLDGREIEVWKFRSMKTMENGTEVVQAKKNDSRLTPIGGFLRKSSIDELPQLFNVLFGTMSMVGPRPHATAHNEYYRREIDGYMLRHKVKPGITGLAQVNGCRGETDQLEKMEQRIFWDHRYIRDWSLWMDITILFRTFAVVFSRQNAY